MSLAENPPPLHATSFVAGPQSQAFDDLEKLRGARVQALASLTIWVDGVVCGLRCSYRKSDGKIYRAPMRGTAKGKKHTIELGPDEALIQLSGRCNGASITNLSLLTTTPSGESQIHGPFGQGSVAVKEKAKEKAYRSRDIVLGGSDDHGFSFHGQRALALRGHTREGRISGLQIYVAPLAPAAQAIESTVALSQDYRERRSGSRGQLKLEPYAVHRATISLPTSAEHATLWAAEQLSVSIGDKTHVLDPNAPTRVPVNALSKIVINIAADSLSVPAIKVRTDDMHDPWASHIVHPELAAHEKLASWGPDTLYDQRKKLGIGSEYTREDCASIQSAVANISRMGLPGKGQASHERLIDAANMDSANWVLDMDGESLDYAKVDRSGAAQVKQAANQVVTSSAAAGKRKKKRKGLGLNKLKNKTKNSVSKVVVETKKSKPVATVSKTAEKAGKSPAKTVNKAGGDKVIKAGTELGKNAAETGTKVGNNIAKGNISGAAHQLGKGTLQLGKDVATVGKRVFVTIIHVGGEAMEYVLDRTVALGKLIGEILETIGVKILKLINSLLDLMPWKMIAATQKQLEDVLEGTLATIAEMKVDEVMARVDTAFDQVRKQSDKAFDSATRSIGAKVGGDGIRQAASSAARQVGAKTKKLQKGAAQLSTQIQKLLTKPLEAVYWLLDKILSKVPVLNKITSILEKAGTKLQATITALSDAMGKAAAVLPDALASALSNIVAIIKRPQDAPVLLVGAMLQLSKGLVGVGVEVVRGIVEIAVRAVKSIVSVVLTIGRLDMVPGRKRKSAKIPVFDQIYNALVGGNASIFKMLTFVLAIPVTFLSLAVNQRAPKFGVLAQNASSDKAKRRAERDRAIASACIGAGEQAIVACLDGMELARGPLRYIPLGNSRGEVVQRQKSSSGGKDGSPKTPLEIFGEVVAWMCKATTIGLGNPWQNRANAKTRSELEEAAWWIESSLLCVDFAGMLDFKRRPARLVRWDISDKWKVREGAAMAILSSSVLFGLQVTTTGMYAKDKGVLAQVGDWLGSGLGVAQALFLTICDDPEPDKAGYWSLGSAALGVSAIGLTLANDLS